MSDKSLETLSASTAAARSEVDHLKSKLTGYEAGRYAFVTSHTLAEAKAYDQDIADTKLAIEQSAHRFRVAQVEENGFIDKEERQKKAFLFASATVTNSIFWAMFQEEYIKAATTLMGIIEAGDSMCRQISKVNDESRLEGVQPLSYAASDLGRIRRDLVIPSVDGPYSYFSYGAQRVAFPENTDPAGDFIKRVTDKAAELIAHAKSTSRPTA